MKELYLVRHAKSDWNSPASTDFARPLNKRGMKDAKRIGKKLLESNWIPQHIISSTAERAVQTCELICERANIDSNIIEWKAEVYEANVVTLLEVIAATSNVVDSLMIVGHNPGMEWLLLDLCDEVPAQTNGKILTTANVVKIQLQDSWCNLQANSGELVDLLRPKAL